MNEVILKKLITIIALIFILSACGARDGSDSSWAGVTADDNGTVYIAWGDHVTAIDVASQTEKWKFPAESGNVKYYAQPEIAGDNLILGDYGQSGGFFAPGVKSSIYSINKNNGTLAWKAEAVATDRIIAQPLARDGHLFVGTAENSILALSVDGGTLKWSDSELEHAVWGQPAYVDGTLIVSSMDHNVYAFDSATGTRKWVTELGGASASEPIIVGSTAYVTSFDGKLHALDVTTGDEKWAVEGEDWVWNAPAVLDNMLFFGDVDGNVYGVNSNSGNTTWNVTVNGAVEAGLVAENGTVYVPVIMTNDDNEKSGKIVALNAADGKQKWEVPTKRPIFGTPVAVNDALVVPHQKDAAGVTISVLSLSEGTSVWTYQLGEGADE